jgi:hypothetical protein
MVTVDLETQPTTQEKARMVAFLRAHGFSSDAAYAAKLSNIEAADTRDGYVSAVAALHGTTLEAVRASRLYAK